MTGNHHLEFPSMLLGYFELLKRRYCAKATLELDKDTLLSKSGHLIANKNFVLFHSMKALQSLKDGCNDKSYLRLCATKQTRSCASSFLQTELRERDN